MTVRSSGFPPFDGRLAVRRVASYVRARKAAKMFLRVGESADACSDADGLAFRSAEADALVAMTAPVFDETALAVVVVFEGVREESLFRASSRPDIPAWLRRPPIRRRRCNVVLFVGAWADFDLRPSVPIEVTNAPGPEESLAGILEPEYGRAEYDAERRFLLRRGRHHMKDLCAPM